MKLRLAAWFLAGSVAGQVELQQRISACYSYRGMKPSHAKTITVDPGNRRRHAKALGSTYID
jgi:hypothetical protein